MPFRVLLTVPTELKPWTVEVLLFPPPKYGFPFPVPVPDGYRSLNFQFYYHDHHQESALLLPGRYNAASVFDAPNSGQSITNLILMCAARQGATCEITTDDQRTEQPC